MYLWKYWRESRILFGVSLLAIALLVVAILREDLGRVGHSGSVQLTQVWMVFLAVQSLPLCFVAWIFGSFGVGRDLGERSGSFIFSRPRNRAWFLWSDWGFGLLQVLVIVICLNLAGWLQIHRVFIAMGSPLQNLTLSQNGHPVQDIIPVQNSYVNLKTYAGLACLAAFLLAALVFSLTYFSTILVKSARGVFVSAGIVLGYIVLGVVVKHYWPSTELPRLLLQPFTHANGIADHLGFSMAIRAAIVAIFPVAAQFVLQKIDV